MKHLAASACLVICLAAAGPALADGPTVASLEQPLTRKAEPVVDGAIWHCEQGTCVAYAIEDQYFGDSTCADLARFVGRISAYKTDNRSLTAAQLERCNAGVGPGRSASAAR